MEKVYITDEEKKELDSLTNLETQLIIQLGELEFQIYSLEQRKDEVKKQIGSYQIRKNQLAARLQQKYGDGSIDPETGEFIKNN